MARPPATPPRQRAVVEVPLKEGQELRDEFTCPITRQLMRVPVIAADGHTYDRSAIERWLLHHEISPKTGQRLEHKALLPNHNLKRLIDDLVREGGRGLYSNSSSETTSDLDFDTPREVANDVRHELRRCRRASLVSEPVLLLRCVAPADSEWNGRTFEVYKDGALGGRRRPPSMGGADDDRDFMPFNDSTVSRRHFEIVYSQDLDTFRLRDLGSASGTFRRLRPDAAASLDAGAMVMIGKHQLVARKSVDDVLVLECFAPDGSPLQGQVFTVKPPGATLGRRLANAITFSHDVDGELLGIDSSVSAEHARILYDNRTRRFHIRDGNADGRPSTNGTWIRLSALHAPSQAIPLSTDDELLVGIIRFHATVTHTVLERTSDASEQQQQQQQQHGDAVTVAAAQDPRRTLFCHRKSSPEC
ncbi:hypothetical protein CTAYLR_006119 [Chrysophaeum taylorii]|uniref:FHA domain-containing protein n=1 Tax=Chrysophaeum taylorii TaxID=2483200 RepID=A0AAD7UAB3_9STRA|nr:hypothetical protein CTAYLR_006119 [Chrysophaeum taylorii]